MAYIEPQMTTVWRVNSVAILDALHHMPRHNIAAREFLFFRFCIDHESMQFLSRR